MAKFVANLPFDALAASASFYSVFVNNATGEFPGFNANVVGFDGETYRDFYIYTGATEQGAFQLALAGELTVIPGPEPTVGGTVNYLAVASGAGEDLEPLFYFSELGVSIEEIAPLVSEPLGSVEVHPVLLDFLSGDDDITLSAGTDYFDAGTGFDTANYLGAREQFTVAQGEAGRLLVQEVAVPVNADTLDHVEKLTFTDGSLIFDLDSANADFAYRIYAAAYGRTPDEAGLRFWTDVLDQRGDGPPDVDDKEFVASFFLTADEFADVYGADPTNEEYINGLYEHVLKREADQAGYDFWLGKINEGEGRDDLLIFFTDSEENIANVAPDIDNGFWVG